MKVAKSSSYRKMIILNQIFRNHACYFRAAIFKLEKFQFLYMLPAVPQRPKARNYLRSVRPGRTKTPRNKKQTTLG